MTEFLFDEIINVVQFDAAFVYDKVSRVTGVGEDGDCKLDMDVHSELYPMLPKEKYRMLLSNTLTLDGSAVQEYFPEGKQKSLADKFEYVMHGLLYKMAETKEDNKVVAYISFGGLQMKLEADSPKMRKFKVDQKLFLLLRKI